MLGTVAAGWTYIGCEPNTETYTNLLKMIDFLGIHNKVKLHNCTYEDFDIITLGKVDIVLTSPPYFDIEIYGKDTNQSYQKYSEYDDWLNNWYVPMIVNNLSILKDDGLSCYNIMNGRCENIVEQTQILHTQYDMVLIDTLGIDSPFKNYKKKLNKLDLTYVFKKNP